MGLPGGRVAVGGPASEQCLAGSRARPAPCPVAAIAAASQSATRVRRGTAASAGLDGSAPAARFADGRRRRRMPSTESDGRAVRARRRPALLDRRPAGHHPAAAGRGFSYRDPTARRSAIARSLARIRALAIPPAWTDVWICPMPAGHLQATGRDARGRKQYRYHARWRAGRDDAKFERMIDFARALPRIRERCDARPRQARACRGRRSSRRSSGCSS